MQVLIIILVISELLLFLTVVYIICYYNASITKLWKEMLEISEDLIHLYKCIGRIKEHDETLSNMWCRINQLEIKFNHFQRRVK